jgi:polyisoprenyl-teichoic acid--peptidoglycan teichoic acid transferase
MPPIPIVGVWFMRVPGWLFVVGMMALVGVTALCSVVSFGAGRQLAIDAGQAGIQVASIRDIIANLPTPTPFPTESPAAEATATVTLVPGMTPLPTIAPTLDPLANYQMNDPRTKRILLLGIDQRRGFNEGDDRYFRTDTMMVVNIDPVRKTVGILSIPRDLWVDIPDGGQPGRINTANSRGDSGGYPGGGPALAVATVEQNLGLRIDNYLLVNFDVFTTVVNTVAPNGVEICVRETIDDPTYPDAGYGTIHVHFDPGCQSLDAERLLQYARTRKTQGSDFDRARRQQEVIKAMQAHVLSLGGIGQFITQAPTLWNELKDSFKTDLTLEEIISLGVLAQDIPRENIRTGVIDNLYVEFAKTAQGDDILIPNYNAIRGLIQQVFNPPEELPEGELRTRALAENATIAVFNNTDVAGLAGQTRDWLASKGITIAQVGNTSAPTNEDTIIRDYGGNHTFTARYLAELFGLPIDRIQPGADGLLAEGVAVIVGGDIQPLLTGQ